MDTYLKIFTCKLTVYTLIVILLIILSLWIFGTDNQLLLVAISIGTSVYASFLVGAFFQNLMKEEFSKEHFQIMQHKDAFNESGIIQYSGSFSDILDDLRLTVADSKEVTIYIAYGRTVLSNLKESINKLLNTKDTTLNIYLLDKENPFVNAYEKLWGYGEGKLSTLIDDSNELLVTKIKELKEQNELRGKLHLYSNKKYPIHSSFYICDNVIYFVPSKHNGSRDFVPQVVKAQKTINKKSLFNKVTKDLEEMRKNCELTAYKEN